MKILVRKVKGGIMTDTELKALTSGLLSLPQDMKDPARLPEEGYRCYWRGVGDAVSAMFDVIGKVLPSAQPDIKQAAKLLSDFIESCPGGDSYLKTPDGEELRTDRGYATEGIKLIYEWAERRNDG